MIIGFEEEAPPQQEAFSINSAERAAWAVDKLNTFDERLKRLDEQYKAMKKQIESERESFSGRFMLELEDWARANLPTKGKTIKLLTGDLGFRRVNGGPRVVDKDALIAWAEMSEEKPSFLTFTYTPKIDADAVKAYVAETGELLPGVAIVEDEERFFVKGAA